MPGYMGAARTVWVRVLLILLGKFTCVNILLYPQVLVSKCNWEISYSCLSRTAVAIELTQEENFIIYL